MSGLTNIGWTDRVWNPTTGCSVVSPGCENCYAATLSLRRGWSKKPWTKQNAAENVILHPDRLEDPLRWRKPARVFVNSMSDLFHEQIPDEFIHRVFAVMALAPEHTFQVLTKRPERMRAYLLSDPGDLINAEAGTLMHWGEMPEANWPLRNLWLGVSVEDERRAEERIPVLLDTPAAVRWISAEPLLGRLPLAWYLKRRFYQIDQPEIPALNWVVVGGESGPGRRDMNVDWALDVAAQCSQYAVPLFMKQDSGPNPGKQGRLPDSLWARKEFPR